MVTVGIGKVISKVCINNKKELLFGYESVPIMVLFCLTYVYFAPYYPFCTIKTPSARFRDPVDGVFCFITLG